MEGDHMEEKKSQTTSPLKVSNRFTPLNSCILLGRVFAKIVQRIVTFPFLDFCHRFILFGSFNQT